MQQQSVTVNFRNVKNMGLCLYISMKCSLIGCALITNKDYLHKKFGARPKWVPVQFDLLPDSGGTPAKLFKFVLSLTKSL